jgi:hypothetical protein
MGRSALINAQAERRIQPTWTQLLSHLAPLLLNTARGCVQGLTRQRTIGGRCLNSCCAGVSRRLLVTQT